MMDRGIVDLRDLSGGHRWWDRSLTPFLEAAGIDNRGPERSQFHPPHNLLVVCPADDLEFLELFRVWLGDACSVVLVLEGDEEPGIRDQAQGLLESVSLTQVLFWSGQVEDRAVPRKALALCRESPVSNRPSPPAPPPPVEHPTGPWISYSNTTLQLPRLVGQTAQSPMFLNPEKKNFTCLLTGQSLDEVRVLEQNWMATPSPRGDRVLQRDEHGLSLQPLGGGAPAQPGPHGVTFGWAYNAPVAHAGYRCIFHWLYISNNGVGWLSQCEHDWPCGHAKKQYAYLDNSPQWVHLTENCDAYLSMFDKDAIVSSSVPVR